MNTNIKIHCTLIMCVHKGSHEWSRDGCVGVRAYRPAWVSEPTGTTEAQHRPPWGQLSGFCASLSLLSKSPPLACFAHHFQSIQPRILSSCIWIPATLHCSSCFKTLKDVTSSAAAGILSPLTPASDILPTQPHHPLQPTSNCTNAFIWSTFDLEIFLRKSIALQATCPLRGSNVQTQKHMLVLFSENEILILKRYKHKIRLVSNKTIIWSHNVS